MIEPKVKTSNKFKGHVDERNMCPLPMKPTFDESNTADPRKGTHGTDPAKVESHLTPIAGGGYKQAPPKN